jgi:hypothetical protein
MNTPGNLRKSSYSGPGDGKSDPISLLPLIPAPYGVFEVEQCSS